MLVRHAIAIAAALASVPALAAPGEKLAENTVATDTDIADRMTVPVMINGKGPFKFVIDTGADRTVISTDLAERLGLPAAGRAKLHAMGGSAQVDMVRLDSVQVSTNTARNVRAAALLRRHIGADGLLGIDSLKGQRIVMDFKAQTMRVEPSSAPEEAIPPDGDVIVVTARTRLGQLVMVDADAEGQKLWVVVDTGAQNSVGNNRLRKLLLGRNRRTEIKTVNMIDVIGQRTEADYTMVGKLRIGGIALGNAAIAFAEAHPFKLFDLADKPSMLLGMESLRAFRRVSVDFTTRKVKFLMPEESSLPTMQVASK